MEFNEGQVKSIVQEIEGTSEGTRKALAKRRHDIYVDGGRKFLIDQIKREFGTEGLKEMRLAPINILKKIVNKKSSVYGRPPVRTVNNGVASDQALVDYYVEELSINELMQKANRYYTLFSNCVIYLFPKGDEIHACVVPPYLYSVVPDSNNPSVINGFIFSKFIEESTYLMQQNLDPASGVQGYNMNPGYKTSGDMVDSQELDTTQHRNYIFWTDQQHFTTDENGNKIALDPSLGPEQFLNPIEAMPVINLAKDRDAEAWAKQGEDMIDLAIALQLGWTDLLTIAKHQGFSILTIVSPEEPKQLTVGINRAVWLKQQEGQTPPSISYVQGNSPLEQYKGLLMDLLGLLLTTNDMSPGSVSGMMQSKNFTSGFQALIEMSDTIQALEEDKPVLRSSEQAMWTVLSQWHNFMYDQNLLNQEAASLGKFSEQFEININFSDMKPIESEQERIAAVKDLMSLNLMTQKDALKKLYPDLTDDQIDQKIEDIAQEKQQRQADAMAMLGAKSTQGGFNDGKSNETQSQGQENQGKINTSPDNGGQFNG